MSKKNQQPTTGNQPQEIESSQTEKFTEKQIGPAIPDWEAKATEYLNDLKRVQADFENYKKRQAKDQAEMTKFMVQGLVADLIPILDNFNMAVTHVPEEEKGSPWVTGITYIEKQFEDVLGGYGVKPLEVMVGEPFDPTKHEAISVTEDQRPTTDERDRGGSSSVESRQSIVKVVQKGYMIGEKVIRAAKVIVS